MKYALALTATLPLTLLALNAFGCASTYSNMEPKHSPLLNPASTTIEETPENADLLVQRSRLMPVSAECAYGVLADVNHWPDWASSVKEARWIDAPAGHTGSHFYQDLGDFQANTTVLAAEPGRRLRWRGQAPDGGGPVGVHTWTFIPQGEDSTLVLNDEHFHAWYLRLVGPFTDFGISDMFDKNLAELEREALRRCALPASGGS